MNKRLLLPHWCDMVFSENLTKSEYLALAKIVNAVMLNFARTAPLFESSTIKRIGWEKPKE